MAGNSGYVGRFGDTLRKLTALDASQGAFAPQQIGGADTASAFSAAPPGPMQAQPGMPPAAPVAPMDQTGMGSGFDGAPAPVAPPAAAAPMDEAGAGAMESTPTSWGDFAKALPKKAKDHIADQIESKVGDLKAAYKRATTQEGVPARPRASRAHMAMFLAEIALRAAANRGSSGSDGEALAKGVLQTQDRRAALAQAETDRARQEAETRRLETRADTNESTRHTRDRGEKLDDDKRNHEQALELERLRQKAEKLRAKGQNVRVVVGDDGEYKLIDLDTKEAVTVTEEVTETAPAKGSRGKGTTPGKTTTTRKPVKAAPKANAAGLDQDTVLNKIAALRKEMLANSRLVRKLKAEGKDPAKEIERIARETVEGDVASLGGNTPSGSGKVIDFNDL